MKRNLLFAMAFSATIALTGNNFAATVFTYNSTPDDATMSMPADQGWTQVAVDAAWEATYDAGYNNIVSPAPRYVAHINVLGGTAPDGSARRGYIYKELTGEQETDALVYGWELNLRARFYQTWNTGFSPNGPDHELGFGLKTSGGDAMVGHKLQRQTDPENVFAIFTALYGNDGEDNYTKVETPRIGDPEALYPSYLDYTLSYDPSSAMTTLTVADVQTGHSAIHTITNNLAPSSGLWDGATVGEGEEENMLPAALYIGYPDKAVNSGHAYIDYLTFSINGPPPAPGDADENGIVNAADAAALASNWLYGVGMETPDATWAMGDFNDDGIVNDVDATILAANWQTSASSAAVPEPATIVLLLTVIGFCLIWRR